MSDSIFVDELNDNIKTGLKKLSSYKVKGEITSIKEYNKITYAKLKHNDSTIDIIYFKHLDITDGSLVIASGVIDFYVKNAVIKLKCYNIELTGEGNILKNLENITQKYKNLGYFDNKKVFPDIINSIGIVTAVNGAVINDMLSIFNENKFDKQIYVKNTVVQGVDCPKSVKDGIEFFNKFNSFDNKKVDIIVIARGGGSMDDLIGFSDPVVIEAIHNSKIYVISAVGHEPDTMISDYVADYRAGTPSIGARYICDNTISINKKIDMIHKTHCDIQKKIRIHFDILKRNVVGIKKSMYDNFYFTNEKKLENLNKSLDNYVKQRINKIKININTIKSNIDVIKNSEYNAAIFNTQRINEVNELKNGIYTIKINGKYKKVELKIVN